MRLRVSPPCWGALMAATPEFGSPDPSLITLMALLARCLAILARRMRRAQRAEDETSRHPCPSSRPNENPCKPPENLSLDKLRRVVPEYCSLPVQVQEISTYFDNSSKDEV